MKCNCLFRLLLIVAVVEWPGVACFALNAVAAKPSKGSGPTSSPSSPLVIAQVVPGATEITATKATPNGFYIPFYWAKGSNTAVQLGVAVTADKSGNLDFKGITQKLSVGDTVRILDAVDASVLLGNLSVDESAQATAVVTAPPSSSSLVIAPVVPGATEITATKATPNGFYIPFYWAKGSNTAVQLGVAVTADKSGNLDFKGITQELDAGDTVRILDATDATALLGNLTADESTQATAVVTAPPPLSSIVIAPVEPGATEITATKATPNGFYMLFYWVKGSNTAVQLGGAVTADKSGNLDFKGIAQKLDAGDTVRILYATDATALLGNLTADESAQATAVVGAAAAPSSPLVIAPVAPGATEITATKATPNGFYMLFYWAKGSNTAVQLGGAVTADKSGNLDFKGITQALGSGDTVRILYATDATALLGNLTADESAEATAVVGAAATTGAASSGTPVVITPTSGLAGTAVKITGSGFGTKAGVISFNGLSVTATTWTDTEIDLNSPNLFATGPVDGKFVASDQTGKPISITQTFRENPVVATMYPNIGVAGTLIKIVGPEAASPVAGLPSTQGSDQVVFFDSCSNTEVQGSISSWDSTGISVAVPDMFASIAANKKDSKDAGGSGCGDEARSKGPLSLSVSVLDQSDNLVAAVYAPSAPGAVLAYKQQPFTELRPVWGDRDMRPVGIKAVGGYEEGFQSAQAGSSDAFVAVYGSALFIKNSFGPFYSIRLETAPQTTGTYSVVSVLEDPSGGVKTQSLEAVGTAVDLNVGFEQKIAKFFHGQTTLSAIAGGGYTNPLQANSINASFTMPLFGTVECTELQSRLMPVLTAKNSPYTFILPNGGPSSNPPSGNPCFFNNIAATTSSGVTSGGVAITTLTYAAPDQPNFFPKWQLGLRGLTRFPSSAGLKECTLSNPCDRGFVDFTLGQDASISGGSLKHMVMKLDSIYPLPIPNLNYVYLFGTISRRFLNLPANMSPLALAAAPATTTSGPSASTLVLPMTQPDRDFYRIGVGVSLCQIFTALTTKGSVCPF